LLGGLVACQSQCSQASRFFAHSAFASLVLLHALPPFYTGVFLWFESCFSPTTGVLAIYHRSLSYGLGKGIIMPIFRLPEHIPKGRSRFSEKIMLDKNLERDGDLKQSHPTLGFNVTHQIWLK
jgi:hypothetical protein